MLKRVGFLVTISVVIVVLLSACGSGGGNDSGDSSGNTVVLIQTEMKFTPNTFTVNTGQKVTVKLENQGVVVHDFTVDDLDGQRISESVNPGESKTVSFMAPTSPGTIQFYCSQPGHKTVGMHGTITVQ
jgi:uncharacterized cupredoxin-like copper-binding protein